MSEGGESADPMGFRAIRERWAKVGAIELPDLSEVQRRALMIELDAQLGRLMADPTARAWLEAEHERRLQSLVAWRAERRSW